MNVDRISENVSRVRQKIAESARNAGRSTDDVSLVAVTKYVDVDVAHMLCDAGCSVLAESRPQQLWYKVEALRVLDIEWHLIGHLQRNKVKRTVPLLSCLQSIDSIRLLESVNSEACLLGRRLSILIEVNISGDQAKHGFAPNEVASVLAVTPKYPYVHVRGLMTMASLAGDRDQARRDFSGLRDLLDDLQSDCPPEVTLTELSMGMSRDYDLAVMEGATMVRVGSALFEGIDL